MLGDVSQAVAKPLLQILGFLAHLCCQVQVADRTQTVQSMPSSCVSVYLFFGLSSGVYDARKVTNQH